MALPVSYNNGEGTNLGGWQISPRGPSRSMYGGRRRRVIDAGGGRSAWPRYLGWVVVIVALALVSRLGWQGSGYFLHQERHTSVAQVAAPTAGGDAQGFAPWERDVLASLDSGIQDASAGRMVAAEMDVDRAGSLATAMRLQSRPTQSAFFGASLAELDQVLASQSADADMMDHVTQARIALAELRSSQNGTGETQKAIDGVAPISTPATGAKQGSQHISTDEPRALDADSMLDPSTLGGNYLDATFMPDTAEVLLPPASRAFADDVRVEGLTIAGAAQTLDGIRWRNVTFVGTHVRYEGGPLDLENVHFVNCRFGFPSDAGGSRLANAVALGQTSITIQQTDTQSPRP
jgi:hypothetical protein